METENNTCIHVVYMYYDPSIPENKPAMHLDCTSFMDGAELRKHASKRLQEENTMSPDSYRHYEWYSSVLARELSLSNSDSNIPCEFPRLRVAHWRMDTSATEAFRRGGVTYRYVSAVIGRNDEYAYYALPTHGGSNDAVEVMRPRGGVWSSPKSPGDDNKTSNLSPRGKFAAKRKSSFKPRKLFNIEEETIVEVTIEKINFEKI